ncbi:MAG: hypothetical protein IKE58_03405 [Blautia sp.]|nr:hypothetical protein [Blautia sp.]
MKGKIVLAIALLNTVAGCILAGKLEEPMVTMAYMTDSCSLENGFSFQEMLQPAGRLEEKSWKEESAQNILPGAVLPKDPVLTNISEGDINVLAALRLTFIYPEDCPDASKAGTPLSEEDMNTVVGLFDIDYEADTGSQWKRYSGETDLDNIQHFYYSHILQRHFPFDGDSTVPLFTRLILSSDTDYEAFERLQNVGGFDLLIEGAVLAAEGEDGEEKAREAATAGFFRFASEE